jgi:recombinational DNA repair ATPase RecF
LWLKLAALQYIEEQTKIGPVLLLDDFFSELDEANREKLAPYLTTHQVIMTSAEPLEFLPDEYKHGQVITLT